MGERIEPGILGQVGGVAHSFLCFFQVRAKLLALEAREGIHLLKVHATLLSLGILLVVLGYVGGMAGAISLAAKKTGAGWETILFWVALPHLVLGACLVWVARERLFQPFFDSTLDELEKDQRWLRENVQTDGKRLN